MKKNTKIGFLLFVLNVATLSLFSQQVLQSMGRPNLDIQSPNVTSLGQYGSVPISFYTGLPQIGIPISIVKTAKLEMPITLNYSATGVRIAQREGWVGTNWNLSAGGVIFRTQKGFVDEYSPKKGGRLFYGFYHKRIPMGTSWWNEENLKKRAVAQVGEGIDAAGYDMAPDIFYFSLPDGTSGEFFLNEKVQWQVICDQNVKIEFDNTYIVPPYRENNELIGSSAFSGFTIVSDKGIRYQFGKSVDAVEFKMDFFKQSLENNNFSGTWSASAWYLTKIEHPSGDYIDLTYERGDFVCQLTSVESKENASSKNCSQWRNYIIKVHHGDLITPVYLSEITTQNSKISLSSSNSNSLTYTIYDFFLGYKSPNLTFLKQNDINTKYPFLADDTIHKWDEVEKISKLQWRKLDKITIKDKKENIINEYEFQYKNNPKERLFLTDLSVRGKNYLEEQNYKFKYYDAVYCQDNRPPKIIELPPYLSYRIDHWGFFNNFAPSLSSYAVVIGYNANSYTWRRSNGYGYELLGGSLSHIIYPTKGVTEFVYEAHEYGKQVKIERWKGCENTEGNIKAGGLRIKKIQHYDNELDTIPLKSKEYYYTTDYPIGTKSSGVLERQIKYTHDEEYLELKTSRNNIWRTQLISSVGILPGVSDGMVPHVGYSEVTEKDADGSYTVYKYHNFDNTSVISKPLTVLNK